jgi:spore maturation protein CgeB
VRFVMFCHSLISDWNHGNAHFLRGTVSELLARGHHVTVYEPSNAWSVVHLEREAGASALGDYRGTYPQLNSVRYTAERLNLERALAGADVVLVHEWNAPDLIREIGARRRLAHFTLLFHDTHHRSVTAPEEVAQYDLSGYDGVLAFGRVVAEAYDANGWCTRGWVWHEAADVRVFRPRRTEEPDGDLVWIGNWGDDERTAELEEFLIEPVRALGLKAAVYGVRYPPAAVARLWAAGIEYHGWIPNYRVPEVFGRYRTTIHVPRRPYARALSGIPTIRVFEALACGIPLVSAPWSDSERLFAPGRDFLVACDGTEMREHLRALLADESFALGVARHGLNTVRTRHTCAHRVNELLAIVAECRQGTRAA